MQNQEITDPLVLHLVQTVEFVGRTGIDCCRSRPWHEIDQVDNRRLDQENTGGFERLEEAARQSNGNTIAQPGLVAPAGRKPQQTRLTSSRGIEAGQQSNLRVALLDELAGINIAVAGAMLEWNSPLPSGQAGRRACIWRQCADSFGRYRHRPITGQPVSPVVP